jgi:hypothetical protein
MVLDVAVEILEWARCGVSNVCVNGIVLLLVAQREIDDVEPINRT